MKVQSVVIAVSYLLQVSLEIFPPVPKYVQAWERVER